MSLLGLKVRARGTKFGLLADAPDFFPDQEGDVTPVSCPLHTANNEQVTTYGRKQSVGSDDPCIALIIPAHHQHPP